MAHQLADLSGAQEKDQHRPGPGEGRGVFALRHGGSSGRPREDDALAHIGAGEFAAKRRCCREHAADARDDGCGHAFLGQPPDLLVDRAVHGGIAGVQAHDTLPGKGGIAHGFDLFPQIHGGAIEAGAIGFAGLEVGGVDQRTRVDHEIRLFQSAQATHGDEILRARSGADEFDECFHEIASLWNVNT